LEPLIASPRQGRETGKNTNREQRSKSNTITPRTARDQRENTTGSGNKNYNNIHQTGGKSHEVSI